LNPVLSISSPGFQKSSPGFVKYESGFCSSPGPGFSRVRIFFESESGSESESGPGFEVCHWAFGKVKSVTTVCVNCVTIMFKIVHICNYSKIYH
jgi:hypothetical protein